MVTNLSERAQMWELGEEKTTDRVSDTQHPNKQQQQALFAWPYMYI